MIMRTYMEKIIWRLFPYFQKFGIHIIPVHYYSPIPDTGKFNKEMFEKQYCMTGVDIDLESQMSLLLNVVKPYENEYINVLGEDAVLEKQMPSFAPLNALVLYAFIRYYRPKTMIEVGSGMSTMIAAEAFKKNISEGDVISYRVIDPFPSKMLSINKYDCVTLISRKVEDLPVEYFSSLHKNDILFIDSSHTVKIFGDVNYLFLDVLPMLDKEVIIHVHDIFFPHDYLQHHFFSRGIQQIWQEQYLLHAFLLYNSHFSIMMSNSYIHNNNVDMLEGIFSWYHSKRTPSSFWMKRIA